MPPQTMKERVAAFDWAQTPLGPMASWPRSLVTAVGICMNSRFPMFVWWGKGLINIYNDAYAPMLGKRHPTALGMSAPDVWADIWHVVGPEAAAVMERGESTWNERTLLVMERKGFTEDTWFTWSYSPILDEQGAIGGVFCVCTEDTSLIHAERNRDRAEAELVTLAARYAEQSRRYDRMLASIADFAYTTDRTGRFTFVNKALLDLWGRRLDEVIGKTFGELDYTPELAARLQAELEDVVTNGATVVGETPYQASSGQLGYYQYIFTPVVAGDGSVEAVAGTTRDITAHKRAEATLRAAEERSRTILESITDGYFALDRDWRFTDINPQAQRILELTPGDVLGRTLWEVYPGLVGTEFETAYRRTAEQGQPSSITAYYPDHQRWYEVHSYPVLDGITVYFRDVTEQKLAEEALREGARRLELVLASAQVGDWDLDLGTDTSRRSLRHDQCFGYDTPVPHWGRETLLAHVHPADRAAVAATFDAGVATGATWQIDCRVVWPDRTTHWIALHGSLYHAVEGRAARMLGIVFDITERKRVEHEVRELAVERESLLDAERAARTEADRASKMKDEFLATLSHELRTPLHAILGWSQMMQEARDTVDLQKGLAVIERNARAQAQIIDDLLDMSRIISGKVQLDVQRIDLATIVATAVETTRPPAAARGVVLQTAIDPLDAVVVHGDASRLQQILWNLLTNAIKFTPRGGRVEVRLQRQGDQLELAVADTGEGIAPEFLPFVFDRFRQADATTTRRHGGLGLGLAIVKQLVELHGGSIRVHSDGRGCGTTFTVTLPLAAVQRDAPRTGEAARNGAGIIAPPLTRIMLDGVRVLVVDDEPDARALVKRLLEDCHAAVTDADSAGEAIRLIEAGRYDVLVSDIGMPGEDGYALIRRVRSLGKGKGDVPAIALTAYARTEDRVKAISSGFQMHVAKPVEPLELITMVAGAAGRIGQA